MSVLVDYELKQLCLEENLLVPFDEELLNPASIDVRIGNSAKFEVPRWRWLLGQVIPFLKCDRWVDVDLRQYSAEYPRWVKPKEFFLVATHETFNVPNHVVAEFRLKSSRAREGWENVLAVFCDPGWHGSKLTLELLNESRAVSLPVYPGLKIGQIFCHSCKVPDRSYKQTGRYNNDRTVAASKG